MGLPCSILSHPKGHSGIPCGFVVLPWGSPALPGCPDSRKSAPSFVTAPGHPADSCLRKLPGFPRLPWASPGYHQRAIGENVCLRLTRPPLAWLAAFWATQRVIAASLAASWCFPGAPQRSLAVPTAGKVHQALSQHRGTPLIPVCESFPGFPGLRGHHQATISEPLLCYQLAQS